MIIKNYTPHEVNIVLENGEKINLPSVGLARCTQTTVPDGVIGDIPITKTRFGEVEGLPDPEKGAFFIVSRLVMQAAKNRKDLLVPNEIIRDDTGRIVGCKSLANN